MQARAGATPGPSASAPAAAAQDADDGVEMLDGDVEAGEDDGDFGRVAQHEERARAERDGAVGAGLHVHAGGLDEGGEGADGALGAGEHVVDPALFRSAEEGRFLLLQGACVGEGLGNLGAGFKEVAGLLRDGLEFEEALGDGDGGVEEGAGAD